MRTEHITDMQLDAMRELGSIGAGHAATALSQLLDTPVGLAVPSAVLMSAASVPDVFGGPETLVGAVYCRLLGDIGGAVLFLLPEDACGAFVDILRGLPPGTTGVLGAEEQRLITHSASLLASAYIAAISRMTGLALLPSTPQFALDMAGGVLEVIGAEACLKADLAVLLRTRLSCDQGAIDVALFFLPDPDSLEVVLAKLGVG